MISHFKFNNEIEKSLKLENGNYIYYKNENKYLVPISHDGNVCGDFLNKTSERVEKYDEYKTLQENNKLKNILIYGNNKNPKLQVSYVYPYIYTNDKNNTNMKRFIKTNFSDEDDKIDNDYVIKEKVIVGVKNGEPIKSKDVWLFTELGLMKALFVGKSKFCKEFQKFILEFLKLLRDDHYELYKNNLEKTTIKIDELENKLYHNQNYIKYHNDLQNIIGKVEMKESVSDKQELNVLKHIYYKKKVDVYVVNTEHMRVKPVKKTPKKRRNAVKYDADDIQESSSDDDTEHQKESDNDSILEYEYDSFNLLNLDESNEYLYFTFQPKSINSKLKDKFKYNYIHTINFYNNDHYKLFIDNLVTEIKQKNIYETTFSNIMSKHQKIFINMFLPDILKKVRKDPDNLTEYKNFKLKSF